MDVQVFGNLPLRRNARQEHSFPGRPFDLALDGERAFVAILTPSEQAFPEHPFSERTGAWLSHPLRRIGPMSATALQNPALRLQPTTVPPGPDRPSRPQLRVLEGGRAPSRLAQRATFRRRRLVALALVLVAVVAFVLLATAAVARFAGGAPSAAGGPPPTSAAASSAAGVEALAAPTVVVQPGDTLWSIAAEIAPDTDVRIIVDQLVEPQRLQPDRRRPGARLLPGLDARARAS